MSLEIRVDALAVEIANQIKADRLKIGNTANLTTTATDVVNAINEVSAAAPTGVLFAANNLSDVSDAASARTNLDVRSTAQVTTEIASAVSAVTLAGLGGLDQAEVDARVQLIVGAAPAALDTLTELADALGNDPDFAATITGLLANKVDFSVAQTLTAPEQLQACQNIGVGNPENDFVATFTTALNT